MAGRLSDSKIILHMLPKGRSAFKTTTTTCLLQALVILSLVLLLFSPGAHSLSTTIKTMASTPRPKRVVVVGGGIQGMSVAYHCAEQGAQVMVLEAKGIASAASGKGGGFMARSWGDGSPTQSLHEVAFDMYETMAPALGCTSYRKLPVLSVVATPPGQQKQQKQHWNENKNPEVASLVPNWLDGEDYGRISSLMGRGDDTAQITPSEFVQKLLEAFPDNIQVVLGTCLGMETTTTTTTTNQQGSEPGATSRKIVGVKYKPRDDNNDNQDQQLVEVLEADAVVISAGPWSCQAEDWFQGAVKLPMEGVKSTSIVWKKPQGTSVVDATALFCGEDDRFGTHRTYHSVACHSDCCP
jgi:FAD dependent oxidoreductase